jgi:hypothetical protein
MAAGLHFSIVMSLFYLLRFHCGLRIRLNIMPSLSNRPYRRKQALIACAGIVLGTVCFCAGRFSVQLAVVSPGTNATNNAVTAPTVATVFKVAPPLQETPHNAALPSDWGTQWRKLTAQAATKARNRALAELLEKLAITDPKRAMALAEAEGNLKLRADLEQAALRGWGSVSPADAVNWALSQSKARDRNAGVATVLASAAAANPEEAVRVANLICKENPGAAVDYGASLIDALCNTGNFAAAMQYAASGTDSERQVWTGKAYMQWAELQPEQAAAAANAIADPDIRNQALHAVVGGWAETDPAALTQFLTQSLPGGDYSSMIGEALHNWVRLDPVGAANWINDNSSLGPDLDEGVAAVANMDLFMGDIKPEVMVGWAASITDPTLRSETVANVLRSWLLVDPTTAQNYFNTTTDLLPADREQINNVIADLSHNAAQ